MIKKLSESGQTPKRLNREIRSGGELSNLFHQSMKAVQSSIQNHLDNATGELAIDVIDQLRNVQQATNTRSPVADQRQCGAGCSACCFTIAVDVTAIEAIACADYLKDYIDPTDLEIITNRLTKLTKRRREMSIEERKQTKLRCGLLDDQGMCQVYPVRPLICAGVFSFDQNACDEASESVETEEKLIPLDRMAKVSTMGYSAALQRVLVDSGLDGNLYELNSAVLTALETDDCLQLFLQGKDVFKDAICTDAHSAPRKKKTKALKPLSKISKRKRRSA